MAASHFIALRFAHPRLHPLRNLISSLVPLSLAGFVHAGTLKLEYKKERKYQSRS